MNFLTKYPIYPKKAQFLEDRAWLNKNCNSICFVGLNYIFAAQNSAVEFLIN